MLKKHSYDLIYYILGIIFSIIFWILSFRLLYFPKNYESLNIMFIGEINDYSYSDKVYSTLDIRKANLFSANPNIGTFNDKYVSIGLNKCDVIILPHSILEQTDCAQSYQQLTIDGYESYSQNGVEYAIKIPEEKLEYFSNYFALTEEDYYIAIPATSVNAGEITNNAIIFIEDELK